MLHYIMKDEMGGHRVPIGEMRYAEKFFGIKT
jgi:hypothetical protein